MDRNEEIRKSAIELAKNERDKIVDRELSKFAPAKKPITMFTGGSPGSGKSETADRYLNSFPNVLKVDVDELRKYFTDYVGGNAALFQEAVGYLGNAIHDEALKRNIDILYDTTFWNENSGRRKIKQSLECGRKISVYFVYQSPEIAWEFVLKRELREGRKVEANAFVSRFNNPRITANKMKAEFGDAINITLFIKDANYKNKSIHKNIDFIDGYLPKIYTDVEIAEITKMKLDLSTGILVPSDHGNDVRV